MEPKEVDFEITRGDTTPIVFDLKDYVDNALTKFDEIYFTMKKNTNTQEFILQKRLTRGQIEQVDDENFAFELAHKDTASLAYGNYVYDVSVVSGTYVATPYIGTITLTKEVTFISNE
jgi:hypothetical protein